MASPKCNHISLATKAKKKRASHLKDRGRERIRTKNETKRDNIGAYKSLNQDSVSFWA